MTLGRARATLRPLRRRRGYGRPYGVSGTQRAGGDREAGAGGGHDNENKGGFAITRPVQTRVNERIRIREVRVIDEEGNQVGILQTRDALDMARSKGLDLVEVAPNAVPPVCRLMDYGKFRYEQSRRERESRQHQHVVELKEIRLQPKIADHDVETKRRQAMRFLDAGDRVKFTVRFRGREMAHPEIGRQILEQLAESLRQYATLEQTPRMEGRTMTILLSPLKQKQSQAERERERERAGGHEPASPDKSEGNQPGDEAESQDAQGRQEALQDHFDGEDLPHQGHEEPQADEEVPPGQADVRPDARA